MESAPVRIVRTRGIAAAAALALLIPAGAVAQASPLPMGAPGAPSGRPIAPPEPGEAPARAQAGVEYAQYYAPPASKNRFIIGGLVSWAAVLCGALLLLERRRAPAFALGGLGLLAGLALMLSGS